MVSCKDAKKSRMRCAPAFFRVSDMHERFGFIADAAGRRFSMGCGVEKKSFRREQ